MAYFSNSTDGDILEQQCERCPADKDGGCPIHHMQMIYNYKQLDKGNELLREAMNVLIDEKGICQMRPLIADDVPKGDVPAWLQE